MRILKTLDEFHNPQTRYRRSCHVLYAMVCGALFGLCSNAYYSNGTLLAEDSENALMPDVLYGRCGAKIKQWATMVGHALQGHQDLLFEMFLGKQAQSYSLANMASSSSGSHIKQQTHTETDFERALRRMV